ncbi:hypothetical protein [Streptomyces tsukubensis]
MFRTTLRGVDGSWFLVRQRLCVLFLVVVCTAVYLPLAVISTPGP